MLANLGGRCGQYCGSGNPACLAARRIGLSVNFAVGVLVGYAEDGKRSIRKPVLCKLYRRYFICRRDDWLMGKADRQQSEGA